MEWIERLTDMLTRSQALILALSGALTTLIAAYQAVRIAWVNRNMAKLRTEVIKLVAANEKNPLELYHSLVNKPEVNPVENDGKTIMVVVALKEREARLLKRCKMTDPTKLFSYVSEVYQDVKPVVKAIR